MTGGDLYYNTTSNVMKVYLGSAWVSAYVPGDAANIISTATGDVAATNVQAAIAELDTEKVPVLLQLVLPSFLSVLLHNVTDHLLQA